MRPPHLVKTELCDILPNPKLTITKSGTAALSLSQRRVNIHMQHVDIYRYAKVSADRRGLVAPLSNSVALRRLSDAMNPANI